MLNPTFVYLPSYERSAKGLVTETMELALETALRIDPEAGPVMPGTGGWRKLRVATPGRGKSGGARVIYLYLASEGQIFLVLAYAKNVITTLSQRQKAMLKTLASQL